MPSTFTHHIFALDVYDKLDDKTKNRMKNNLEEMKLFAQGPDVFMFFDIGKVGKSKSKQLGKMVHKKNSKAFFLKIISYIKENKLENNYEVIGFLYGFICHYALDSVCHPFIFYKTGVYRENKETLKYIGLHDDMESIIDAYFIKNKLQMRANKFKPHKYISEVNSFSNELNNIIDNVFKDIYGWDNISNIYFKAYQRMKRLYRIFRYDPYKIKRTIYTIVDRIKPKKIENLKWLSYNSDFKRKLHYMNFEKEKWNHPLDKNEVYNYSFIELYVIAWNKAVNTIKEVNKVLYEKGSIKNLDNVFDNSSYVNGKNCEIKDKMQYFEF
jgi:hypothetical protein